MEEIRKKRGQIGGLIQKLAQREHGKPLRLPLLQFESPGKTRSSTRRLRTKLTEDQDAELGLNSGTKQPTSVGSLAKRQASHHDGSSSQLDLEQWQVRKF